MHQTQTAAAVERARAQSGIVREDSTAPRLIMPGQCAKPASCMPPKAEVSLIQARSGAQLAANAYASRAQGRVLEPALAPSQVEPLPVFQYWA